MDTKRQGEIALKVLKHMLRRRGINLNQEAMRDFGNVAKAIDVPVEELKEFAKPLYQEILNDCFADKK